MAVLIQPKKLEHSPTLNTVLMVEDALKKIQGSVITIADLKRKLPRQVNHNILKVVLEYLQISNKIAVTVRGITWIQNNNLNLRKIISAGYEL